MHRNIKLGLFSYRYHLAFGKHDVFQPKDHPPMDLFRFMDRAVELGLDGIQIDPMHLERTDPDYLAQIVAYAGQRNLYIEYGTTGIEAGHLLEQLRIAHALAPPSCAPTSASTPGRWRMCSRKSPMRWPNWNR